MTAVVIDEEPTTMENETRNGEFTDRAQPPGRYAWGK